MTEQEYCDLSDLQLFRHIKVLLRDNNCFDDPNKSRVLGIEANLELIIKSLEPKIFCAFTDENL